MSSGERPIGVAKGKQSDTEASCQPPPPPLQEQRLCQRAGVVFAHFRNHVLLYPLEIRLLVRATVGVVSIKLWDTSVALARGGYILSGL